MLYNKKLLKKSVKSQLDKIIKSYKTKKLDSIKIIDKMAQ